MTRKRPWGITLIGYFYVFGAAVLVLSLFLPKGALGEPGIAARFGLHFVPEMAMRVTVSAMSLVLSYGYLKIKKWGYWLMVIYSAYFLVVSLVLSLKYDRQPFIGNMLWSAIVLIYTMSRRQLFYQGTSG